MSAHGWGGGARWEAFRGSGYCIGDSVSADWTLPPDMRHARGVHSWVRVGRRLRYSCLSDFPRAHARHVEDLALTQSSSSSCSAPLTGLSGPGPCPEVPGQMPSRGPGQPSYNKGVWMQLVLGRRSPEPPVLSAFNLLPAKVSAVRLHPCGFRAPTNGHLTTARLKLCKTQRKFPAAVHQTGTGGLAPTLTRQASRGRPRCPESRRCGQPGW